MSTRKPQASKSSIIHLKHVRTSSFVRKVKPGTRKLKTFVTKYNGAMPSSGGSISYPHARRRGQIGPSIAA